MMIIFLQSQKEWGFFLAFFIVLNFLLNYTYFNKNLGGTNIDGATSIQNTEDNGLIFKGTTLSNNGDVNSNKGGADLWVVKLK